MFSLRISDILQINGKKVHLDVDFWLDLGYTIYVLNTPEEKSRFEHLYLENRSIMYNYAMEILKDSQLAEDAVQDAFMKLIKYMDHIKGRNDHDARNYLIIIVC